MVLLAWFTGLATKTLSHKVFFRHQGTHEDVSWFILWFQHCKAKDHFPQLSTLPCPAQASQRASLADETILKDSPLREASGRSWTSYSHHAWHLVVYFWAKFEESPSAYISSRFYTWVIDIDLNSKLNRICYITRQTDRKIKTSCGSHDGCIIASKRQLVFPVFDHLSEYHETLGQLDHPWPVGDERNGSRQCGFRTYG